MALPAVPKASQRLVLEQALLGHGHMAAVAFLALRGGRSPAAHTKASTSKRFAWHWALIYLCNCIKINDSLFVKRSAPGPPRIHCCNNSFDFSHQGMRQLSNSTRVNTSLPFTEHTPFCIIHCNLEITLTCGIMWLGRLIRGLASVLQLLKIPGYFYYGVN